MAKVTTKLQVTIPKAIADQHDIRPGDEIDWVSAGDTIRVVPKKKTADGTVTSASRLDLFDQATRRQSDRQQSFPLPLLPSSRGWAREDLYPHGRTG